MSDAFSKIVAILLAVVMMYVVPVFYMREEADRLRQTYVLETVISFVDGVRNTGIFGREDYNRLMDEITGLGEIYSVELTHSAGGMEDVSGENYYYTEEFYNEQIFEHFQRGEDYYLAKNDYLKIVIKDSDDNIIAWYGGSVKVERSSEERLGMMHETY